MPRRKPPKTKKAARKRFKITATGKVMRSGAGRRHLLGNKSAKHRRRLRRVKEVEGSHADFVKAALQFDHRG